MEEKSLKFKTKETMYREQKPYSWNEREEVTNGMKKSWNERKGVTNGRERLQRKDGGNEMDELKGKEEQDEQERSVEAKGRR